MKVSHLVRVTYAYLYSLNVYVQFSSEDIDLKFSLRISTPLFVDREQRSLEWGISSPACVSRTKNILKHLVS